MPINISLTDFIDFMVATGTSRLTKVKQVKCRPAYHPSTDYWKPLRESIVDYHDPLNMLPKDPYFQNFLDGSYSAKTATYTQVVTNYKKFLGRKKITGLPVQRTTWEHRDLTVRVNPEIFLNIDGSRELIKLYFKQDALSKAKTDAILELMREALPSTAKVDHFAIYDGRNNRIIRAGVAKPPLMILARAEAEAYISIWNATVCV